MPRKVPLILALTVGATACDWNGGTEQVAGPTPPLLSTVTEITMEDIGSLGDGVTIAWDQNELGQVVGSSAAGYAHHAFLWEDGNMMDLGALIGWSSAYAVNELGQQVVGAGQAVGGGAEALFWDNGSLIEIGRMDGFTSCYAHAVNDAGRVVGQCSAPGLLYRAFVWEGGAMIDLGDLGGSWTYLAGNGVYRRYSTTMNESGRVVGWSETADGEYHGFVWDGGVMVDLGTLGGDVSYAAAVNELGHVTGGAAVWGEHVNPFFWDGTEMTDIGRLGTGYPNRGIALNELDQVVGTSVMGATIAGFIWDRVNGLRPLGDLGGGGYTRPLDINNLGQVVGYSLTAGGENHAFFWDAGTMIDLGKLEGSTSSLAYFINDAGQIIGRSDGRAVMWTVVMRPATPLEETQILIDAVEQLVASGALDEVAAGQLLQKLNVINFHLTEGTGHAAALFEVLLMDVERYVSLGWLTQDDAGPLIDAVQNALAQLGS